MRGNFEFTRGEVIKILVGQQGKENKNISNSIFSIL